VQGLHSPSGPSAVQPTLSLWWVTYTYTPTHTHTQVGCEFEARMPSHPDNPHPFGQVPALQDDDGVVEVWESGAILLYLADR